MGFIHRVFRRNTSGRFFLLGCFVLALSACGGPPAELSAYDMAQMRYEQALRWQDYQGVASFHKNAYKEVTPESLKRFKKFKVTEYKVISDIMNPDLRHDVQTVEIRYFNSDYQIVHSMTLVNRWEYDPKKERWYLTGPMPEFK